MKTSSLKLRVLAAVLAAGMAVSAFAGVASAFVAHPYPPDEVFCNLSDSVQQHIEDANLNFAVDCPP